MSTTFQYFQWQHKSGEKIRGSLHITKRKGAPWFLFCHGFTGQRMGPGYLFVKLSRALADSGFSSLRFDFRGSGESDGAFAQMNVKTMRSDLVTITNELREKFEISKLILLGHSFGGMISAFCAEETNADGLVLLSPVGDPKGLIQRRKALLETGMNNDGYYENGPHEMSIVFLDGLLDIDPVKSLTKSFRNPLLLIQGDTDKSISVKESGRYVHSARRCGVETEYHIVKGADHNYSSVPYVKMLLSTVSSWARERFL